MVTDQASLFPREAVGTLPVEELESISRVGKAARLVKTRIGIARTMPHRLCPLRGVLDAGNLIFQYYIYNTPTCLFTPYSIRWNNSIFSLGYYS